jgi:hypothetical protein
MRIFTATNPQKFVRNLVHNEINPNPNCIICLFVCLFLKLKKLLGSERMYLTYEETLGKLSSSSSFWPVLIPPLPKSIGYW